MQDEPATAASQGAARPGLAERFSLAVWGAVNGSRRGKAVQDVYLRGLGYGWMRALTGRRMLVEGADALVGLSPGRGVMLVANHRSYFDFFGITVAMFGLPVPWLHRVYFPVRGRFFHTSLPGFLVNLLAGFGVMYPPFFQERGRRAVNRAGVDFLVARLRGEPGSVVGIHPEGTRNRSPDAYGLRPLNPGAGEIAVKAAPVVVPVFVNGLPDRPGALLSAARDPAARRDRPLIVVFGAPVEIADLAAAGPSARTYSRAVARFGEAIMALGERERALRAACAAGDIPDADARWLHNRRGGRWYARRRPR